MGLRLLNQEQAAVEWGWREGMCFGNNEEEDYMLELFLYISSNKSKKRERGWDISHITPLYRQQYEDFDLEWFSLKKNEFEILWVFQCINEDVPLSDHEVVECQRLKMISVSFNGKTPTESSTLSALVYHVVCCNTLEAFYYIKVGYWFARCGSMSGCVDLLDEIAVNMDKILHLMTRYCICKDTIIHLSRKMPLEEDPVRLAYMCEKVGLMKHEAESMKIIV